MNQALINQELNKKVNLYKNINIQLEAKKKLQNNKRIL